jgi:phosphate transport system permease protein
LSQSSFRKRTRIADALAQRVITVVAATSFAVIVLVFAFVFREALPFFFPGEPAPVSRGAGVQETYGDVQETYGSDDKKPPSSATPGIGMGIAGEEPGVTDLMGTQWQPVSQEPKFGLLPLIIGSFKVSLIAVFLAAPLAILAALYTSTIAPRWAREFMKPAIEILAGFPSVVIGFFALITLASFIQNLFGFEYRLNAFVGGAALAVAVLPIIYTLTEDALSTVPKSFTEASLALGASRWQTALFVVLPAAIPGVYASVLLGIGRAFGETMIVLMATGNAAILSGDIFVPVRTMSATIGAEMAEVVFGDTHYNILFLIGSLLFLFTFSLNAFAEFVVKKQLLKKFGGTR